MTAPTHHRLDPDVQPPVIRYRDREQTVLHQAIADPVEHLSVAGPRGAGKTLLIQDALTTSSTTVYYLSCIPHNTQYKVLARLYASATEQAINPGYHTAQLQHRIARQLRDTDTVIVLDDLAFLLANDGNDLLYFLSRLKHHADLCIVGITANQTGLATALDERTYSSLRPREVAVPPYTMAEATRLLADRAEAALPPKTVEDTALESIAAATTNITLGLHWLTAAAAQTTEITADAVQSVQETAVQRYRTAVLRPFTAHHRTLLNVITRQAACGTVTTGSVYDYYVEQCRTIGCDPLTARRISDYLTHLELLNLIDVTYHAGGEMGKTREIRPTPLQKL